MSVALVLAFFGLSLVAGEWTQLPDAGFSPRGGFQMVVSGDNVIVAGGTDDPSKFYNDAYRLSLSDGNWYPLPFASPQWGPRANFGMSGLANGTLVMTGGQQQDGAHASLKDVWALDTAASKWRQLPDATWPRRVGHAQSTCKGAAGDRVVVTGGASSDASIFMKVYNDVWSMSPDGSWTQLKDAPWHTRFLHATTCISDGSLVLTGGHSGFQDFNDVWLMSSDGAWKELTPKAPFPTRARFGMVSFADDSVLVGRGMGDDEGFWIADNVQDGKWRSLGRPPFSERYDYGLVALPSNGTKGRKAILAGGQLLQGGLHNYNNVYRLAVDDAVVIESAMV